MCAKISRHYAFAYNHKQKTQVQLAAPGIAQPIFVDSVMQAFWQWLEACCCKNPRGKTCRCLMLMCPHTHLWRSCSSCILLSTTTRPSAASFVCSCPLSSSVRCSCMCSTLLVAAAMLCSSQTTLQPQCCVEPNAFCNSHAMFLPHHTANVVLCCSQCFQQQPCCVTARQPCNCNTMLRPLQPPTARLCFMHAFCISNAMLQPLKPAIAMQCLSQTILQQGPAYSEFAVG